MVQRIREIRLELGLKCTNKTDEWADFGDFVDPNAAGETLWLPSSHPDPDSVALRDNLQLEYSDILLDNFGVHQLRVDQAVAIEVGGS